MDVVFGFMTGSSAYRATIPDDFVAIPEHYSVATLDGAARSIQHVDTREFDSTYPELTFRSNVTANGQSVAVYDRFDDPGGEPLILPFWSPLTGMLWSHVHATEDGDPGLNAMVNGLVPRVDSYGVPRVTLQGALTAGNMLEPPERDMVAFNPNAETVVPWSISFVNDGGLGVDSTQADDEIALVSVTSRLGISVACDGPTSDVGTITNVASSVAASIGPAVPTFTCTVLNARITFNPAPTFVPLINLGGNVECWGSFSGTGSGEAIGLKGGSSAPNPAMTYQFAGNYNGGRCFDEFRLDGSINGTAASGETFGCNFHLSLDSGGETVDTLGSLKVNAQAGSTPAAVTLDGSCDALTAITGLRTLFSLPLDVVQAPQ